MTKCLVVFYFRKHPNNGICQERQSALEEKPKELYTSLFVVHVKERDLPEDFHVNELIPSEPELLVKVKLSEQYIANI